MNKDDALYRIEENIYLYEKLRNFVKNTREYYQYFIFERSSCLKTFLINLDALREEFNYVLPKKYKLLRNKLAHGYSDKAVKINSFNFSDITTLLHIFYNAMNLNKQEKEKIIQSHIRNRKLLAFTTRQLVGYDFVNIDAQSISRRGISLEIFGNPKH